MKRQSQSGQLYERDRAAVGAANSIKGSEYSSEFTIGANQRRYREHETAADTDSMRQQQWQHGQKGN